MTPNLGGWIHSFAVTETQTHKGGYTIYKITSIVFPRTVPQALTCLTVWKRFHDVKKLHRELNRRHRSLQLPGKLPEPTDSSYFKRFDENIIRQRRDYILELLDFTAQHPALYKCHAFAQFFSDPQSPTQSPLHCMPLRVECESDKRVAFGGGEDVSETNGGSYSGAIEEICDKLDLPYDPHANDSSLLEPRCDKTSVEIVNRDNDPRTAENAEEGEVAEELVSADVSEKTDADVVVEGKCSKDYTRFLTPMASIESDDSDYIFEAALEFSRAVQAEVNLEYKEAHTRYKRGVEVLLNGSKDDSNDERKFIAEAKISKYLARAEDIFERFLRHGRSDGSTIDTANFQLSIDVTDSSRGDGPSVYLERPWNHLSKYKVLSILGESVLQVKCITEPQKPTYAMKGIDKPASNSPTQSIFLPQHVPYMADLVAFFQSEQKIFLLLRQAEGGRLYDYVRSYSPTVEKKTSFAGLFPEVGNDVPLMTNDLRSLNVQDSGYVEDDLNSSSKESSVCDPGINGSKMQAPSESTDLSELLRCSQQLLQSVSNTLNEVREIGNETPKRPQPVEMRAATIDAAIAGDLSTSNARRIPEASLKRWARELVVAIHALHDKGVILGDLHMENLLLGGKGQLMLSYFYQHEGLVADNYVHKAPSTRALNGHFVAPERPLTFKSDWWSYGVVLYQLLIGETFKSTHPGTIDYYYCIQYPENVEISESARDLLESLLQKAPEERLSYEHIREHSFFEGTNWEEVEKNCLNASKQ